MTVKYVRKGASELEIQERMNALIENVLDYKENAGTPVSALTPDYVGQWCFDTSGKDWYRSVGTTSADWKAMT